MISWTDDLGDGFLERDAESRPMVGAERQPRIDETSSNTDCGIPTVIAGYEGVIDIRERRDNLGRPIGRYEIAVRSQGDTIGLLEPERDI